MHSLAALLLFHRFISWTRHPLWGERYIARIPKGYSTMLTIGDTFTHGMRTRLKTTSMGLGLVRLLQDAGRIEEARTTLDALENSLQGIKMQSEKPSQNPCAMNRFKGVSKSFSYMALSGRQEVLQ